MKSIILFCFLLLCPFLLLAQDAWDYDLYDSVDHTNFRNLDIFYQEIDFDNIDYPLAHAAIFFVTNEKRVEHGLEPLEFAMELERAAWNHSKMMVEKNFFDHNNYKDRLRYSTEDRAKLAGISNPYIAENIAYTFGIQYIAGTSVYPIDQEEGTFSYSSNGPLIPPHTYLSFAEELVAQWMNSPGHRANILSTNGLQMGCGIYFYMDKNFFNMPMFKATQNFQWYEMIIPMESQDPDPES
jgi:uncharacterized protein YkwD